MKEFGNCWMRVVATARFTPSQPTPILFFTWTSVTQASPLQPADACGSPHGSPDITSVSKVVPLQNYNPPWTSICMGMTSTEERKVKFKFELPLSHSQVGFLWSYKTKASESLTGTSPTQSLVPSIILVTTHTFLYFFLRELSFQL